MKRLMLFVVFLGCQCLFSDILDHSSYLSKEGFIFTQILEENFEGVDYEIKIKKFFLSKYYYIWDPKATPALAIYISKKHEEEPFLVLVDSGISYDYYKFYQSYTENYPSIDIDTYIPQKEFKNNATFCNFLRRILNRVKAETSISYPVIRFAHDPYDLDLIDLSLDPNIINILSEGSSFAKKVGASTLLFRIQYGNNVYTYQYKSDAYEYAYHYAKNLVTHITLERLINSIKPFSYMEEGKDILNFLEETMNYFGMDEKDSFQNFFNKIYNLQDNEIKTELIKKLKQSFFNFQNPLISAMVQEVFQKGLEKDNIFHSLLAWKIQKEGTKIGEKTIERYRSQGMTNLVSEYDNLIDSQYESIKNKRDYPVEKKILSMNEDQIIDILLSRNFLLYPHYDIDTFQNMYEKASKYLSEKQKNKFSSSSNLAYPLEKALEEENSWYSYFFGYNPKPEEDYLLWFFCLQHIEKYNNFFYNLDSFWNKF